MQTTLFIVYLETDEFSSNGESEMSKCPAPVRIVSKIVDGSLRPDILANAGVIVFCRNNEDTCRYARLLTTELSQANWRFGPDPVWDDLWTKYRRRWKIIIGTMPYGSNSNDSLAVGTPVCSWIAVQFDDDNEWMHYRLASKVPKLRNIDLTEETTDPAPPFDPARIIPCPPARRKLFCTTDDDLENLNNSIVVYAFEGLAPPTRIQRLTVTEIGFEHGGWAGGKVSPDGLFDYLHTKYRNRWRIYINTFSFSCSPRLAINFEAADDLADFSVSWPIAQDALLQQA